MNWFLIAVVGIFAGFAAWGFYKGFLRMVFRLFSWILVLLIASRTTPYISQWLVEHTSIEQTVQEYSGQRLRQLAQDADASADVEKMGISLPDDEQLLLTLGDETEEWLESNVYDPLVKKISTWIIYGITFLAMLILTGILMHWIAGMIDAIGEIPVVGTVNRLLGMLTGGIIALLLIWLFMAMIALSSTFGEGETLLSYINEAELLKFLYKNNLILECLLLYW